MSDKYGYIAIETLLNYCENTKDHAVTPNDFMRMNRVDVVEVVRCKDCKHGDTGIDEDGNVFWKCLGIHYGGTKPNDFCSYGERKDNEID